MLSTSTTTVAEETGDPELSMIDRDMSKVSPRIVLLSGSRSSGLSIVRTVSPLLLKVVKAEAAEK